MDKGNNNESEHGAKTGIKRPLEDGHFDDSFFKAELKNHMDQYADKEPESKISDNLKMVLKTAEKINNLIKSDIKFSEPILKQGENAVIFPRTINVIQGQAGVHKSRLAEIFATAFLIVPGHGSELLGFIRPKREVAYTVVYVDTERNLTEQLPYAMQSIVIKSGHTKTNHPSNFKYISLLTISRKERFAVLEEYLQHIKQVTTTPLFIVLDVSTDCIEDFNRVDKSMELIDLLNIMINEHDVTFLCLIHENPKSEKARGHFGTELMNKASTHISVGFEKDAGQNDTDIIRIKYLKCRSTARYTPFHVKYCDETKGLVLADLNDVAGVVNGRKQKVLLEDLIESIEKHLGDGTILKRVDLLEKLLGDFTASQRTIESRISEALELDCEIFNVKRERCKLSKETKEKTVYYKLIPYETQ